LLLGAGDTGKSTIFHQMQLIKNGTIVTQDLASYKPVIFRNLMASAVNVVTVLQQLLVPLSPEIEQCAKKILDMKDTKKVLEVNSSIEKLWSDSLVKQTYITYRFKFLDQAEYFMNNCSRICSNNAIIENDILHARAKTNSVVEFEFKDQDKAFRLVDVGGQRNERKKWIHCFEKVTAVIFVASLADYDQTLIENSEVNCMSESVRIFGETINSRWFANTHIMLILNKLDLFEEKIKTVDPKDFCFPNYEGGLNKDEALKYMTEQFSTKNKNPERIIYIKHTCALQKDNIDFIFKNLQQIIFQQNIAQHLND